MPKSIGEPVKVISVTLTEAQIEALRVICDEENINRSEWVRARINERMVALHDYSEHNHLPIVKNERGGIWAKLGKSNPNPYKGQICRACWPDGAPKMENRWGKNYLIFQDGSEVRY